MPELSSSPPRNPSFRIAPPHHFLSLSETTGILSPRGQTLPALIGSRSATNLRPSRRMSSQSTEDFESDYGERPRTSEDGLWQTSSRKSSIAPEVLLTPQMRSMRLIGNSNPRYRWGRYYKSKEELKEMKKSIRGYYERNNFLISQYLYIDRLLDSSLPHNLIQEYHHGADIPQTISEEPSTPNSFEGTRSPTEANATTLRVKRTPKALYKLPDEATPLLDSSDDPLPIDLENGHDESVDSGSSIVAVAIAINFVANAILLAGKVAVIVLTSSLSVLASLVDGVLDFLSTAIVYFTTKLIARQDQYSYPIGRRQLEPIGVLVFSVIMITSFFQVALECFTRLTSDDRSIVELGTPAIAIMISTVVIKGGCWFWCRLIKNSSVQALAQDAMTDVIFNTFSIIFPLVGFYARIWWLDALGGLLLSLFIIVNWSRTSAAHIRNLTGAAASADERNVLLYLTMRFAKTIKQIQGIQAYHRGDKLNVEVDIILDEAIRLRDSHDLGESLQYVLESVPMVDRAFVHMDYRSDNLPTHMQQQE